MASAALTVSYILKAVVSVSLAKGRSSIKRTRKGVRVMSESQWPKGPLYWQDGDTLYCSIPFTWDLKEVYIRLMQRDFFWESATVGGPAVELFPDYFNDLDFVTVGHSCPGVLQRINPAATRTTLGCPNRCGFCAVPKIEGGFRELEDWPDLPVICDNNILKASAEHLDKVFDRLEKHEGVDFNQGLDFRLVNDHHIERLARLKAPKVRLACDKRSDLPEWNLCVDRMIAGGVKKTWLNSYALIGWKDGPGEAWERCEFIAGKVRQVCPMWFHRLDATDKNQVSEEQRAAGWTDAARKGIMAYYYQHRGSPPHWDAYLRAENLQPDGDLCVCGGKAVAMSNKAGDGTIYFIECQSCGAQSDAQEHETDAWKCWRKQKGRAQ